MSLAKTESSKEKKKKRKRNVLDISHGISELLLHEIKACYGLQYKAQLMSFQQCSFRIP